MKSGQFLLVVAALILSLAVAGCTGDDLSSPGIPHEGEEEGEFIIISGLSTGELRVSLDQIMELPAESGEAMSISSSGEESTAPYKGVLLETILELHGASVKEFSSLRLIAADGYSIEVPPEILESSRVVLAYELYDGPIRQEDRPLRVVIPGVRTMYWLKMLHEIQLIAAEGETAVSSLYFFENLLAEMAVDERAAANVNLGSLLGLDRETRVILIGADGLVKNETLEIGVVEYFIGRDGEDAPLFHSPDLPRPMYVKRLAVLIHEEKAVLFAGAFDSAEIAGQEILALLDEHLDSGELLLNPERPDERAIPVDELTKLSFLVTENGVEVR